MTIKFFSIYFLLFLFTNVEIALSTMDGEYSDEFARNLMFPMASAAYADDFKLSKCLENEQIRGQIVKNFVIKCRDLISDICSVFVAISHQNEAIIVSFRGTDSAWQLIHEFVDAIPQVNSSLPPGKVGMYFSNVYKGFVEHGLEKLVANLTQKYQNYNIWLTGYSLGGSIASIAAAEFYVKRIISPAKVKLLTFGQTRVGDPAWASKMDLLFPNFNYRVVHSSDMVPHFPWKLMGFQHHKGEVWYDNGIQIYDNYTICIGEESQNCSDMLFWFFYNWFSHQYYFGQHVKNFGRSGCIWV